MFSNFLCQYKQAINMLNSALKILAVDEKIAINFRGYFFAAPCIILQLVKCCLSDFNRVDIGMQPIFTFSYFISFIIQQLLLFFLPLMANMQGSYFSLHQQKPQAYAGYKCKHLTLDCAGNQMCVATSGRRGTLLSVDVASTGCSNCTSRNGWIVNKDCNGLRASRRCPGTRLTTVYRFGLNGRTTTSVCDLIDDCPLHVAILTSLSGGCPVRPVKERSQIQ